MALGAATGPARAQDATWLLNPGSGDFNTAANWSPATVPTGTAFFGVSNTTALSFSANTTVGGFTFNAGASNYSFTNSQIVAFNGAGIVVNGGSAAITNNNFLQFLNTSTAGSATITNNVFLDFRNSSTAGTAAITNNNSMLFLHTSTAGSATITNNAILAFRDASNAGNATITNNFGLEFNDTSTAGSATITNNDLLRFFGTSTAGSATITNNDELEFRATSTAGSAAITNNVVLEFRDSSTGGTARLINGAAGSIDLSQLTPAGMTAGSIEGAGTIFLSSKNLAVGGNNLSTVFTGVLQDGGLAGGTGGSLTKEGAGTLTLEGINTYTGATAVNGGALLVNGSTATSSLTTVNAGATLGGTGTVGSTVIAGGTLAPGTSIGTITVQGSLAFQAAATYLVEVLPSAADRTNVTDAAALSGTVNAQFAPGSYVARTYTILSATGGLGGTTFGSLTTSGLAPGFSTSLSYTSNEVILNLAAALGVGGNLNQNQQNVADTINGFFNNGGALPPGFVTVFGLTGNTLANALTQLSGEHATGMAPAANLATGMFLNAMIDPFVTGRSGGFGSAMNYAPQTPSRVEVAAREAFAADMPVKAPVPYIVEQRWSVWGAAYGGRNRTDGDAVVGSNDLRATVGGFAAGADYRLASGSVIGAAVAIGETRWNVSGVGKGNADVAQIGGYATTRWDALYVSGAVSVGWHRASTDRTLNIAGTDRLEADFNGTSFGGRLEGGYRYGYQSFGVTPYAAVQVTGIHTPAYSEVAAAGLNQFALSYRAESTNDIRSELGAWLDARFPFAGSAVVLRGRAAWVHDYNPGSRVQAAFQTLPGTSFTVDGAAAPRDAALTSAVAEIALTSSWRLIGKFDGEFASGSHTLAGTGTARYTW